MRRSRSQTRFAAEPAALKISLGIISAAGAGAVLMYFLDPQRGRRRRVLARDKLNRIKHRTSGAVGATSRDLRNRAYGIIAGTKNLVSRQQVSDEVLAERVRARLGSLVSHASSIQVWCESGRITLTGRILEHELTRLIRGVATIRGVTGVENLLSVHEGSESLRPSSGFTAGAAESRSGLLRAPWSSATGFLLGAFCSVLSIGGDLRRNINNPGTIAALGAALLAGALGTAHYLRLKRFAGQSTKPMDGLPHHIGGHNGEGELH